MASGGPTLNRSATRNIQTLRLRSLGYGRIRRALGDLRLWGCVVVFAWMAPEAPRRGGRCGDTKQRDAYWRRGRRGHKGGTTGSGCVGMLRGTVVVSDLVLNATTFQKASLNVRWQKKIRQCSEVRFPPGRIMVATCAPTLNKGPVPLLKAIIADGGAGTSVFTPNLVRQP